MNARTVGTLLRRALAEAGVSQYWLAQRTRMSPVTVCRIVNDVRGATEAQLLRLLCGLLCIGVEHARYLDLVYANAAQTAPLIAEVFASNKVNASVVARRTGVGRATIERFTRGEALPAPAKIWRLFVAAAFDGERLALVNELLETAGYYLIGEVDDDRQTA